MERLKCEEGNCVKKAQTTAELPSLGLAEMATRGDASESLLAQGASRAARRGGPSWAQVSAFANLCKTMIGSGLLTLPWATSQFGLTLSLLGLSYLAYLSQAAIRFTVRCVAFSPVHRKMLVDELRVSGSLRNSAISRNNSRNNSRANTLSGISRSNTFDGNEPPQPPERVNAAKASVVTDGHGAGSWQIISETSYGEPARVVTIFALVFSQTGSSVSYFDFVTATAATYLGTPPILNCVALWGLLSILSLLKQLKSVAWLSAAGLLTYIFVLALLFQFGAQRLEDDGWPAAPALARPQGFGAWFGPAIFAFEGMGTALSIYEAMEDADPRPYLSVVSATYALTYVLYAGVGAFGYLAWGEGVDKVVLNSFPAYNTTAGASNGVEADLTMGAHLALSIILTLSFVLQMTPVYHIVEDLLHNADNGRLPPSWWPLTRAAIVALIAIAGYPVPDMETIVALTGSVAFSAIGFILPGIFFLKLQPAAEHVGFDGPLLAPLAAAGWKTRWARMWDNTVAWLLIVTGFVGGVLGVISVFTGEG